MGEMTLRAADGGRGRVHVDALRVDRDGEEGCSARCETCVVVFELGILGECVSTGCLATG